MSQIVVIFNNGHKTAVNTGLYINVSKLMIFEILVHLFKIQVSWIFRGVDL